MILELDAKAYTALGGILRMIRMGKAPAEKMSNLFLNVCVSTIHISISISSQHELQTGTYESSFLMI